MIYNEIGIEKLSKILNEKSECILYPILKTDDHYQKNSLSALLIYSQKNTHSFNISHPDLELKHTEEQLFNLETKPCFSYPYRYFHSKWNKGTIWSLSLFYWFCTNQKIQEEFPIKNFYQSLNVNEVGEVIPLTKHFEFFNRIIRRYDELHRVSAYDFTKANIYFEDVYRTLLDIEASGIHFSRSPLTGAKNALEQGFYNMFTTTGRPSNSYGRFNYSAINKKDGTRKLLTSRFGEKGMLVDFDFNAYHLRLIAKLIGYGFKSENIHNELGKTYFNTNDLTQEQYEESKQISFRQLYSGNITYPNRFFSMVEKYKNSVYYQWLNDELFTPIYERPMTQKNLGENIKKDTIFNWLLQAYETEYSMSRVKEVLKLKGYKSKIILYVYDSIVIDFHLDDGVEYLRAVHRILSKGSMKLHVKVGTNYHSMMNITDRLNTSSLPLFT
jgi:hypothetical protein